MQDRVPVNPGRVLVTPENGGAAYYATLTRADNPTQEGTPLNKASLLKDTTAALFDLGSDAVPDDVLKVIRSVLDIKTEMEIVRYTGTGTYGADNPNSITFSRAPQLIIMIGGRHTNGNKMWAQIGNEKDWIYMLPTEALPTEYEERIGLGNNANGRVCGKKSEDGKTISWYNGDYASWQYNDSNMVYYLLALFDGVGNGRSHPGRS
jgi:hypothetical protein